MKRTWRNIVFSAWDLSAYHTGRWISTARSWLSLTWQGCRPGVGFKTTGACWFKARRAGSIRIGRNVTLLARHRSNRVGLSQPVMLHTMGDGEIEIGDNSGASSVIISSRSKVRIGARATIGGNVRIYDHDFHSLDPSVRGTQNDLQEVKSSPVIIGDDVFIGVNAMILKGVTIGDRAIIGAGAVVTRSVPADEMWAGNPARKLSK
jgi:acetyltransferase-like isoleucine patch superfamily enzyme